MQMDCFSWVKMMWINKIQHTTNKRNAPKLKEYSERTTEKKITNTDAERDECQILPQSEIE